MEGIYQMLIRVGYDVIGCCKHHNQKGHFVSRYTGFHNKVRQMMNKGLLMVETIVGDEVFMLDMPGSDVYQV